MNTIDLVIPTMWRGEDFIDNLKNYCESKSINRIFIIDNLKSQRPNDDILNHEKIKIVCYGRNIYVNAAWNEGYYRSKADIICLLNDDISVEVSLFDYVYELDMSEIDIIGSHLKGTVDNFHITHHPDRKEELIKLNLNKSKPIGGQSYAFGVCMFVKRSSYKVIPSLYRVWFGDDYLVQKCKNIYALKTSKILGEISKTIVELKHEHKDIDKRIDLDAHNAYHYNHFKNGRKWGVIKAKVNKVQTNIFGY